MAAAAPDTRPEVTFPVDLPTDDAKLAALKKEAMRLVDSLSTLSQQMVDEVFSFGELGMQEEETSKYLTGVLEKNGFKVTRGFAGIPTAWFATWGSGKPVISLGSDVDDIPQANQKPGVGYKDPLVAGAPGHGEGHNSGVPMNITAAIAVKKIMEREHMHGHDPALARRRRRADGGQGVLRARRHVQGRRRRALRARRLRPRRVVRQFGTECSDQRAVQLRRPGGARRRRAVGAAAARSTRSS